jgi:hypothetical protein
MSTTSIMATKVVMDITAITDTTAIIAVMTRADPAAIKAPEATSRW